MPIKFCTFTEATLVAMEAAIPKQTHGEYDDVCVASLFSQFRMYQENRLKINKDSRESKQSSRDAGGDGSKGSKSAKMTGVVKLVPIEGQENTFKVEKVSVPAPAPRPQSAEEEENLAENPEALAAAVAEAAARSATAPKVVIKLKQHASTIAKRKATLAKRKATLAAKKEELANASKAALVATLKEDSGEETETDVETEDEE